MKILRDSLDDLLSYCDINIDGTGRFYKKYSVIQKIVETGPKRDFANFKRDMSKSVERYKAEINVREKTK